MAARAEIRLKFPAPHPAQRRVLDEAARFNVWAAGRRTGKTIFGVELVSEPALYGKPAAWFAPTYKLLAEAWREIRRALVPVTSRVQETEHRLELITGGVIEAWSLDNPDAARGRKYARAIIDEAAMVPRLEEAWNGAIRPTLIDYQGDAWFFSTPKGRTYFWQLWTRGQDRTQGEWRSWATPTSSNPHIPAEEIEAARRTSPERWYRQEFLAEFLDDAGGVFRRVAEASTATEQRQPVPGHAYVIGADWGKLEDFSVFSVFDATARCQVYLDRSNGVEYRLQRARLAALCEQFKPIAVIAEVNAMGEPIVEELRAAGLPVTPFTTTNATKAAAIDALALAFEQGSIAILPDQVQLGELQAYEATRLPSGLMRYSAPEGMHDDTVMAMALAWQGVANEDGFGTYMRRIVTKEPRA